MPQFLVTLERPAQRYVGDVIDNSPERYVIEVEAQNLIEARARAYDRDRLGSIVAINPGDADAAEQLYGTQ